MWRSTKWMNNNQIAITWTTREITHNWNTREFQPASVNPLVMTLSLLPTGTTLPTLPGVIQYHHVVIVTPGFHHSHRIQTIVMTLSISHQPWKFSRLLGPLLRMYFWASLVAQWLRIRLPMQGIQVRTLVQEDPTCCGATKPVSHNYWACAVEPASHNYWSPGA